MAEELSEELQQTVADLLSTLVMNKELEKGKYICRINFRVLDKWEDKDTVQVEASFSLVLEKINLQ